MAKLTSTPTTAFVKDFPCFRKASPYFQMAEHGETLTQLQRRLSPERYQRKTARTMLRHMVFGTQSARRNHAEVPSPIGPIQLSKHPISGLSSYNLIREEVKSLLKLTGYTGEQDTWILAKFKELRFPKGSQDDDALAQDLETIAGTLHA